MRFTTALVTGGNRGIGYELVKQLAERGCTVYAGMRDRDRSEELLKLADGDLPVVPVVLEVTDELQIEQVVDRIRAEENGLDLLVNNAATFAHDEEGVVQTRSQEMLRVLAVNSVSPIVVSRCALPLLEASVAAGKTAVVATVSSGASLLRRELPEPGSQYSYHGSKAALNVYLTRLAADLSARGIISIGLTPGFVLTDMTRAAGLSPTLLPPESAAGQIRVLERVEAEDAGAFYSYSGEKLDWYVE